jgi:hypothetical protein
MQDVTSEDQPSEVETQHGNHWKMSAIFWGEIMRQRIIVIWGVFLYNPKKL